MTSLLGPANRMVQLSHEAEVPHGKKKATPGGVALKPVFYERHLFFGDERQQADKSSPKNRISHSSLIQGRCPSASAWKNSAFTVNQRSQCLQVLVVHIHWTRNHAVPRKLAAHLLLFQTSAAFSEFLQICTGNCCHETTYTCENDTADYGPVKLGGVSHGAVRLDRIENQILRENRMRSLIRLEAVGNTTQAHNFLKSRG
jgi:hypothetical protein